MIHQASRRVADTLRREIEEQLNSLGFLCRVFGRGKTETSLVKKLKKDPGKYSEEKKLIQDMVGIRVVLYLAEDIPIVQEILCKKYTYDPTSSTIDTPHEKVFSVSRHNLIFKLPDTEKNEIFTAKASYPLDDTFEVQLRSIMSEGWHEVEHDLRYKNAHHWNGHDDLNRSLNGIVATLETAEWSMRKILEDLGHRQYRAKNWNAMLQSVLRMRINAPLSEEIIQILNTDSVLAKDIFRLNRQRIFSSLAKLAPKIPVNSDNLVYLWNFISLQNEKINQITPEFLMRNFREAGLARTNRRASEQNAKSSLADT
ncbi:RelA/SpoT domain-containing protein [Herbaspirillum rubrisubalbicans]|uniref:RelA/SpoT domain-containing protein n=1 Tax=Herbaspirillum rubrisubalbicans TaxID=80842 RepID=UPI0015C57DD3|nr:RelA/SpoT domain-containing protein [Herbaspirillum rubrisubalbicans]